MRNSTRPRKSQFLGPWSLMLFVAFIGSSAATVCVIRYGAELIDWLLH